jgi:hypothetical protein
MTRLRGSFAGGDTRAVNSNSLQVGSQLRSEVVVSQSADHANWIAQSRNRHCLVGALSPGMNLKPRSEYRLSNCWNPAGDCDQVSVDAAHDDDWPFFRQGRPRQQPL